MDAIMSAISAADAWLWGPPLIILLLGSHLFLTIRTGFIQRKIPAAIKMTFQKDPNAPGDVSPFGALCAALAPTIGTGNIVGVGTAIVSGGPGAVLWMWLTGVFGIATKYAETFVSVKYRVKDHKGEMLGGAMYAWERAFKKNGTTPWWAKVGAIAFAALAALASFGIGSAVQASAVSDVIVENFPGVPQWVVGLVLVVLVSLVIFGGIKWLTKVCEALVPFMAILYALCCIIILVMNSAYVWPAICLICEAAFTPKAAFGGAVGVAVMQAVRYGCARGLFSNESGMGSAPIIAAAAETPNPARQALVNMTGTFWDTVVVCALTGLVIVSTLLANDVVVAEGIKGAALTSLAFANVPVIGTPTLVVGMILFAYSTIIGWSYYGNRCITYLFGKNAILPYKVVYVVIAFIGAAGIVGSSVWDFADLANGLMVVPNIIVVLLLSGMIARETKHYVYEDHGANINEPSNDEIPVVESK